MGNKTGCLNISYNIGYNNIHPAWLDNLAKSLDRRKAAITFDPHLFNRKECRGLDLDEVEGAVREGRIFRRKCEKPNKMCFRKYWGKRNVTYTVIARYHKNFIEVKTA